MSERSVSDVSEPPQAVTAGNTVSRYVVLEEVGRGGMGRVLRAYDPKLQREVALKELHLGGAGREEMDQLDAEATRRLVAEARAMAKLSHPNVVAVYDVEEADCGPELPSEASGRIDGKVILVMEYVAGTTLRTWLGQERRGWRATTQRFVSAGRGLAAAHAAGLLHRDFKPSNVLVRGKDVKVTDFGLAKAGSAEADPTDASLVCSSDSGVTRSGMVMGTPRYMAPEQHRPGRGRSTMNNNHLTAAADQYAFCVALWEALVGQPPFAGKSIAASKLRGPPPWPGGSVPLGVADAVGRGLSPDPADRWPTMEALLGALEDALGRRRRWWSLPAAGLLAIGGMEGWSSLLSRDQRCTGAEAQLASVWEPRRRAEVQTAILGVRAEYAPRVWDWTAAELDDYAAAWTATHTEVCVATTIRGEQSLEVMDTRMACLQHALTSLEAVVNELGDADAGVVQNAHEVLRGLRPPSRCAHVEVARVGVEPPSTAAAPVVERIRAQLLAAEVAQLAGHYEAARQHVDSAKVGLNEIDYGPVRTEVAVQEGHVLERLGEHVAAEVALRRALELALRWRQWHAIVESATRLMFVVGYEQRRMREGLGYRRLVEGLVDGDPRLESAFHSSLAAISVAQGDYAAAEAARRRSLELLEGVLGPDHPGVAGLRGNLANVLADRGNYPGAEAEHRHALRVLEGALGSEHPGVATSRNNLAAVLSEQGKLEEAEAELLRALELRERVLGPEHPFTCTSRNNLAIVFQRQGRYEEAEAEHRRALQLRQQALGPAHPEVAHSLSNLAIVLAAQEEYQAAERAHRRATEVWASAVGPNSPQVAQARNNLATVLYLQGRYEEAEAEYRWVMGALNETVGAAHPNAALARFNLALVLVERGQLRQAYPFAEEAWERLQQDDIPAEHQAGSAFVLAQTLWATKKDAQSRARAKALAEKAVETYGRAGNHYAAPADEARAWLRKHSAPRR